MFGKLKSIFKKTPPAPATDPKSYAFRWYDVGPENPFGIRILDVRQFTGSIIATTSDQAIAERYLALRQSDGKDLVSSAIQDQCAIECELRFPHNGAPLSGIVFKADSMDVKWDIYIYDDVFYFARSWTGELVFKASVSIGSDSIIVSTIQCRQCDRDLAKSHVFFLLGNHALGRILPHRIPRETSADETQIATLSFGLFGNRACYATYEEITQISLMPK